MGASAPAASSTARFETLPLGLVSLLAPGLVALRGAASAVPPSSVGTAAPPDFEQLFGRSQQLAELEQLPEPLRVVGGTRVALSEGARAARLVGGLELAHDAHEGRAASGVLIARGGDAGASDV